MRAMTRLMHNFYNIIQSSHKDSGFEYMLSLNREHDIYRAHFPGHPVMPGVCILQICRELVEHHTAEQLWIRKIRNVKFLSVINPQECGRVQVAFNELTPEGDGYRVSALVYYETTRFARLGFYLQRTSLAPPPEGRLRKPGVCVVIPVYNNAEHLAGVLDGVLRYTSAVIVVNDGSTDGTADVLEAYRSRIGIVACPQNKGKGHALVLGFDRAEAAGYTSAITMDADGQHAASDLPRFVEAMEQCPGCLIVGSRALRQEQMPAGNSFANMFSNFWFALQTGIRLPDTQTGFRLYPLGRMQGMRPLTSRYEAELELLVRLAWKNIRPVPIRIQASYLPSGGRVTHFRPVVDFLRISLLNTVLTPAAIFYGYPSRLIRSIVKHR